MKKILAFLLVLGMILGSASAVIWDTKLLFTGGQMVPYGAPWFADNGKMYFGNDKDVYLFYNSTSDTVNLTSAKTLIIPGAVTIAGTAVTGGTIAYDVVITGTHTLTTGTGVANLLGHNVIAAGKNLTMLTGAGVFDTSLSTGAFKTSTGTNTLGGNVVIPGTKTLLVNGGAAKFGAAVTVNSLTSNGTITGTNLIGSSLSNTGNTQLVGTAAINGAATTNGLTVNTSQTLAVTSADKLTVGGKIIPQYVTVTFPLSSASTNGSVFVPALNNYSLAGVAVAYNAASTGPGAGTIKLIKCTAGQDPATAGTEMLTAGISLKGTPNTVLTGTLAAAAWKAKVNTSEFVGYRFNTAITTLAGGAVTMSFQRQT